MDSLLERLSQEIHIMRTALPEPTLNEDWGWGSSGGDYSNMIDFSQVDPLSVYPSGIPSVDKPLQSVYPATLKPSESRLSQIGKTGTGGESGSSQHLQSSAVNTPAADVTVYEPERLLNTPNTGVDVDDDSVDVELYGDVGTSHADPTSTSAHAVPHPHTLGLELETLGIVGKLLNSKERIEVGKLWNDAPSWVRGVLDRARLKLDVEQFRTVCRASATCGTPPRFDARNGSTSVNSAAFDMLLSNAGKARRPVEQGSINTARIVSGGVDQVETSTTTMTTNAATTRTSVLSETYAVSGSSCPILQSPRTMPSPRDAESTPPPPPPSSFQKVRDDHQSLLVRRRCQQGARIPRSASAGERPRMSIQPARSPQATPHLVRGGSQALRLLSSKSTPRSANTSLPPSATTQGSSKGTSESNTANAATIRALRTAARSFLTYLQEHEVAGNSFLHAFTDEERQYWYNQCGVHVDQQHTLLHAMAQLL